MTPPKILVVEDEMIIAKSIEKRLKGLGYVAAGLAPSGEEAVRLAAELRPDMILMDINLGPGMDGIEAAALIRTRFGIPVVYLTAHADEATLQRAKLTEPFGYVLKPFEDKDLQTAVELGLYKHKMERQLRENEQWLAATLGSIGDGVIATDEQGRVRFMNGLAERLTGWPQAAALGRDVREVFVIVDEKTRRPVRNPAFNALETGAPAALPPDTILIDKAGAERPVDDSAAPIRDASGRVSGAVVIFRDVTDRRRLEEHQRQAEKAEAVGRLAGGIAHDFNNIMTVITGFSELLLADDRPAADRRAFARTIHDTGKRAAALTQQIMAFGRKQMLVPAVLNLNTVVRDVGAMARRVVGPKIELVTETAPDLRQVKVDPTQIGQVVLNLAANARDAMPGGGRVVVATANADLGEATTRLHPDVKPGRYAMLSVGDTGGGMPAEALATVFEPFVAPGPGGHRTGLGLAIAHGIVKQSGGHIEVSSEVGKGTTFRVYLPAVEAVPAAGRGGPPGANGHETILLVEAEEDVRAVARIVLKQSGYTVLEAATAEEGVAAAKKHRGPIHLLLTDLVMPEVTGRELAELLTFLKPGLRVLFMSGYTEDGRVKPGTEPDTDDVLPKPFDLAALEKKVRDVLDRD